MQQQTFHSIRLQAVATGKRLSKYAREIGAQELDLEAKVLKHAAPAMVAVIGNQGADKGRLIKSLAQLDTDELLLSSSRHAHYRYYHHIDSALYHEGMNEGVAFIPGESEELKKLSYIEVRTDLDASLDQPDQCVLEAEAIVFLVNAEDPWSSLLWKHFALYAQSHQGRIIFGITNIHFLEERDLPVLRKHFDEKISQLTAEKVDIKYIDYSDLFIFHEIRTFLEGRAVRHARWAELSILKKDFNLAFGEIEKSLIEQRSWLNDATAIASGLQLELSELRRSIRCELLVRIESMGDNLKDQAEDILQQVRARLTIREYIGALFKSNTSLNTFQDGLESILSEALYQEIGAHYLKTNEYIANHASSFSKQHPSLLRYCPSLTKNSKKRQAPFLLEKKEIHKEIHNVLRQLRLKPLFRQELSQIDQMTNARLCLTLLMIIAAGMFGSFLHHGIAFGCLGLALLSGAWCFWARERALDYFIDFLDEWFLGVGPRLTEPIDKLSTNLVNHAMDTYGNCFNPYLEEIKVRHCDMPEILQKGRILYKETRDLIKVFQS